MTLRTHALLLLATTAGLAHAETSEPSLRELAAPAIRIGVAMEAAHLDGVPARAALLRQHFNTVTPENSMKWASVQPDEGVFTFKQADAIADLAGQHDAWLVGHTLVWQHQTPDWVFQNATRDVLLRRMRDHIHTVVGRYRGRVKGWDVVNEAINQQGELKTESPWHRIIGPDYIEHAFRFAHEADPDAELYYNDYLLEMPAKREGTLRLVKRLKAAGLRIDGVGMQGHYGLKANIAETEKTIVALHAAGVDVMVTELDISVLPAAWQHIGADIAAMFEYRAELDPYADGLPPAIARQQADVYRDLFALFVKHRDKMSRVTFWGLDDASSWLNHWPIRGRTDYPLLFDRNAQPKPAFHAVVEALKKKETPR